MAADTVARDRSVSFRFCWQSAGRIKQGGTGTAFSTRDNMKTSISSKQLSLAVACALALGFDAAAAAQGVSRINPNDRELWENSTKTIWKGGFGLCWHSGFGPPPGYTECNP